MCSLCHYFEAIFIKILTSFLKNLKKKLKKLNFENKK